MRSLRSPRRGNAVLGAAQLQGVQVFEQVTAKLPFNPKDIGAVLAFAAVVILIVIVAKKLPVVGSKL